MSDEPTIEEIKAIVLAEYKYWSQSPDCPVEISLGATGAASNIYAAIMGIHRAPWHPQVMKEAELRQ